MPEITVEIDKITVVMDAHCALCAGGARWIARRDKHERFRIVPMHTPFGRALLEAHGLDPDDPTSWLYLEKKRALTGFEGWARVGSILGGSARLLQALLLVPKPVRDKLYKAMARNRIRLFGQDDLCHLPDPDVRRRLVTAPNS